MDWRAPKNDKPNCVNFLEEPSSFFNSTPQEFFWKLHNVAIFLWPILLFLHGSQGWIGIGIPLVIVVSGLPIVLYALTRVARMLRTLEPEEHFSVESLEAAFDGRNERRWRYREREWEFWMIMYHSFFYMEIWPIWPDVWWFIMIYIYICVCRCTFNSFWIWCGQYLYN